MFANTPLNCNHTRHNGPFIASRENLVAGRQITLSFLRCGSMLEESFHSSVLHFYVGGNDYCKSNNKCRIDFDCCDYVRKGMYLIY